MKKLMMAALASLLGACAGTGHPADTSGTATPPRSAKAAESSIHLAEGSGRDITMARCPICHSLDYITMNAPVMNRAAWQKTVQKMRVAFGAPVSDEEAAQILDYLGANYSDLR
jgi:cytochrome c5